MTHQPTLVLFRGLVSEYWHCQIETLVTTFNHRTQDEYDILVITRVRGEAKDEC